MFLKFLIRAFEDAGYCVRLPWQVLNAVHYGVPQDRQRLFLLGSKKGLDVPVYPAPLTALPSDLLAGNGIRLTPTCLDALADLPDAETYAELTSSDSIKVHDWGTPSDYAAELHCTATAAWHFGYGRQWEPDLLTSSMRTEHTSISRKRFAAVSEGSVEPVSRFFKLARDGVCNTLRAGTDSARGAFTSPRPIHYRYNRCITVREMARLHGYPDWFRFHVTKWHGARQIGNSVPPPLARAVAASIIRALGVVPTQPDKQIDLGDPALLAMNMGEAAKYWRVPILIGRRDRKSGLRKRTQVEIEALLLDEEARKRA